MKKPLPLLFISLATLLLFSGCGKKEEVSEQPSGTGPVTAGVPVDPATVGTLTGKVTFEGEKPKLKAIAMDQDPVCVKKHAAGPAHFEDGEVNADGTVPNVFVYIKEGADKFKFPAASGQVVLDQNGCLYSPHVLGVEVGQDLHIVSSDPTTHNIHPMPKNNLEWNESQAPAAAPMDKTFARPEVMIPVKCNQHPWMRAYIGVLRHPLFAVTGKDGTFTIQGVPPGDYTVEAWSAGFGSGEVRQEQKVTVGPKESKTADFKFKSS